MTQQQTPVVPDESTALPLVFDQPRGRRKPPRHLADMSAAERAQAVAELGEKPFRAKQLSNHYFSRLTVVPEAMTDIPDSPFLPVRYGGVGASADRPAANFAATCTGNARDAPSTSARAPESAAGSWAA